jgi:hypothetical protein
MSNTHIVALQQGNTQMKAITTLWSTKKHIQNPNWKKHTWRRWENASFILITTTQRKLGCIAFISTCIQATTHAQNMMQQIPLNN